MNLNLREMSREQKLKAMHAIWEDLALDDKSIESPAWHTEALKETEERMQAGSEGDRDWEIAKEELRRRAQ